MAQAHGRKISSTISLGWSLLKLQTMLLLFESGGICGPIVDDNISFIKFLAVL